MNITISLTVIEEIMPSAAFLNNHLNWSVRDSIINKKYE